MPISPPATTEVNANWPELPTETEIYILPNGHVVISDLPAELGALLAELGGSDPCMMGVSEPDSSER